METVPGLRMASDDPRAGALETLDSVMRGAVLKPQSAEISSGAEISVGSVFADLCERIDGRTTATPIIRATSTLDAREIVAAGRAKAATAPDLAGTVVPILVEEPQDVLCGLFAVALAGGVPLVLPGSRTYKSATALQRRIDDAVEKVSARFVFMHGTWQEVSKQSVADIAHNDTAFLQFSSGSVGSPRPLRISHRAIGAQLKILADALAVGPDDVGGLWLPLSHDMGLVSSLLALWLGCPLLLWGPEEFLMAPAQWVGQMADHRVGFWPVIPAGMHVATKALASRGHRLDALQAVLVGADRYLSGCLAERQLGATIHLLDDGFQHFELARDVDLLLVAEEDLSDQLLPAGRLRERLSAAAAADAALVTAGYDAAAERVGRALALETVFRVTRTIGAPRMVAGLTPARSACGTCANHSYCARHNFAVARMANSESRGGTAVW